MERKAPGWLAQQDDKKPGALPWREDKVWIPELARLSVHTEDEPEQGQPAPENEENEDKDNVDGVVSAASPSPHA